PVPKPPDPLIFDADFDPAAFAGQFPLIVSGVEKAFGGRCILRHVSFVVGTQARILIIGENGVGKSTLLRILAGVMPPDRGSITRHPQTRLGYLDQECESLSPTLTLFDAYRAGLHGTAAQGGLALLWLVSLCRSRQADRRAQQRAKTEGADRPHHCRTRQPPASGRTDELHQF
ncbi:MAG TPA: ATP-binding cassette domain-containing protein, partial [Aggregatilineales bacterium]|nr:ATP-binding cassette domain-containing protein [Aggregatilineales bacterium]